MPTAADLLAKTSLEMRPIVERLRVVIAETLPGATETVDLPDNLLAYGTGQKMRDLVVGIIPHSAHVNVQFLDAVDLPDPTGCWRGPASGSATSRTDRSRTPSGRRCAN